MYTCCTHGDGTVVKTERGFLFMRSGCIVSASVRLTADERRALEDALRATPARPGRIATSSIQSALQIAFDEDPHPDDCSLGSDDTWSDDSDDDDDTYEDDDVMSSTSDEESDTPMYVEDSDDDM